MKDPPWVRGGSWKMTRSTFGNVWATEKCDVSLWRCFSRQLQWFSKTYLWPSSLVSGRSYSSLICLIESTLWLTDRELAFIRKMGQLGIIQSTYDPWMAHLDFCQHWGVFIKPWEIWWFMQDSGISSKVMKSSWRLTRSTLVNFWTTEKCDKSISVYFVREIQWCHQNHFWTSSLELGKSTWGSPKSGPPKSGSVPDGCQI